ncbi:hypothetical protein QUF76_18340, partial [Desulfobacterales bacterium HSG16]|nr:hypothetical protein [Desulfobacterales bacterium HSG16]
ESSIEDKTNKKSDKKALIKLENNPIVPEEEPDDDDKRDPEDLKAEDLREIARMKQALPGNVWIPGESTQEEAEEQQKILKDVILIEKKMRKDSATPEEKRIFYKHKIKMVQDKIDIIKYYNQRTAELEIETGKPYLSQEDIEHGNKAIDELEHKRKEYDKELSLILDEESDQ